MSLYDDVLTDFPLSNGNGTASQNENSSSTNQTKSDGSQSTKPNDIGNFIFLITYMSIIVLYVQTLLYYNNNCNIMK
jgi:hypothetical protein